jgi:putative transposase
VSVLEELTGLYPAPAFIRSDNGPEFIAHALSLRRWYTSSGTTTAYIEPGSPWQNGFTELKWGKIKISWSGRKPCYYTILVEKF